MSGNETDQALIEITAAAIPQDIADVINLMTAIDAAWSYVSWARILY